MIAQRMFSSLIVAVALVSPGCAVETADDQLGGESFNVPLNAMGGPNDPQDIPPGSGNGWAPACFWEPHVIPALRKYAVQQLWNSPSGTTYGTLPTNSEMDLVPAACREETLKYLARCALPSDTFMVDPTTGGRYWGWLNIAPNWTSHALATDEQWWMTACLLQHLNGFDAEVPILLDGAQAGLWPSLTSHPVFEKRDSRIWGNLFPVTRDFIPNVCFESDILDSCAETTVIDMRLCDSDPTLNCHLNIVGSCRDACSYSTTAGAYYCGTGGFKNIGSRLMDFSMYDTMCVP